MCKRVNRLFPLLILFYVGGAYILSYLLYGMQMPMWFSVVISQVLILLPAIFYVLYHRIQILKSLPYRLLNPLDVILSLLFGYSLIPLVLFLNFLSMLISTNKIQETTSGFLQYPFLVQIFFIAVVPAFVEEFVFRGIFYHSYRKNGILGAALLSGFIFGVVHLNINQFVYAFVLGIIFALLVEGTGSMFASMIAHFAVNTFSIIVMQFTSIPVEESGNAVVTIETVSKLQLLSIISVWGVLAIAFGLIAFVIYKALVKRNHRWSYVQNQLRKGFQPQNGERFATFPLIITLVFCIGYMIFIEYFV